MTDSVICAILERLLPPKLSDENGNFVNKLKKINDSNITTINNSTKLKVSFRSSSQLNNSLVELAQNFMYLLQTEPNGKVDLQKITNGLEPIQKRRINDIATVLEGIDLVEKCSKNVIFWKGRKELSVEEEAQIAKLNFDIESLKADEEELDKHLHWLKQSFQNVIENQENTKLAYNLQEDLNEIFPHCSKIAIHAPPSVCIEMNTIGKISQLNNLRYELKLESKSLLAKAYILNDTVEGRDTDL